MRKTYLDNGSTSFPKAPGVGDAMKNYIEQIGCNINRGGYEDSYSFADTVIETRQQLKELFHFTGDESHVIFTPSVTYALNFVITGLLKSGDHAITSSMEHNSVARPLQILKDREVIDLTHVPCSTEGFLDMEAFAASFRPETRLVVMSAVSNVSGTVQDLKAVSEICSEKGVFLVIDGAQAAGIIDMNFEELKLSALCVPGHKGLLGPQGIGVLMISEELAREIRPVIHGGTGSASDSLLMPEFLPDKLEAGTLNLPGIAGLKAALEYVTEVTPAAILAHELRLVSRFLDKLSHVPGIRLAGTRDLTRRVGVVSLDFENADNAEIAYILDSEYGIMTRCGLHCAPLAHRSLNTYPEGTVRFAFGFFNTEEDVDYAADAIIRILSEL